MDVGNNVVTVSCNYDVYYILLAIGMKELNSVICTRQCFLTPIVAFSIIIITLSVQFCSWLFLLPYILCWLPISIIYFPITDPGKSDFLHLLQEIRKAFIEVGLDEEKKDTNEWYEIRRKLIPHMESVHEVGRSD